MRISKDDVYVHSKFQRDNAREIHRIRGGKAVENMENQSKLRTS